MLPFPARDALENIEPINSNRVLLVFPRRAALVSYANLDVFPRLLAVSGEGFRIHLCILSNTEILFEVILRL